VENEGKDEHAHVRNMKIILLLENSLFCISSPARLAFHQCWPLFLREDVMILLVTFLSRPILWARSFLSKKAVSCCRSI